MDAIITPKELAHDYRFIRLLGEGANGKTYLAVHLNTSVQVAVKALKFSQIEDLKSIELFKREAAILHSIRMEGIPQFYESIFPKNGNDTCYIIQEYIEYPSLQDILNELGSLSESETLLIIERIALLLLGLQTCYTPPIIHRDIKPSNILCQKFSDDALEAYLIDFGAVANPQKRSGGSTVAGTLGYMAPEQLLGDVSIQSDYYSLGATALHMLTGIPPYQISSDVFQLNFLPVIKAHAPNTSQAMISLLQSLLAPEIDKRPSNAQQLIQMIKDVKRGIPVSVNKQALQASLIPPAPKLSLFDKITLKLFKPCLNPIEYLSWPFHNGMIRATRKMSLSSDANHAQTFLFYEYTFEHHHITYVGAQQGPILSPNLGIQFPLPCKVYYNPKDPRMSWINIQEVLTEYQNKK